jgi:flagellar motor switch/type III secretory pathway protein FliN
VWVAAIHHRRQFEIVIKFLADMSDIRRAHFSRSLLGRPKTVSYVEIASMATQDSPAPTASPEPGESGAPNPGRLPTYTRSLLRIEVPVVVTLAAKKQSIGQIVELGPGSIIHFDKSCEEMLDLSVGDRRIAQGEAVKVGDKFGLRVTSVVLPDERFKPVRAVGTGVGGRG